MSITNSGVKRLLVLAMSDPLNRTTSVVPESDQNVKRPRTGIRGLPVYSWIAPLLWYEALKHMLPLREKEFVYGFAVQCAQHWRGRKKK
jgi:hypothetical protein